MNHFLFQYFNSLTTFIVVQIIAIEYDINFNVNSICDKLIPIAPTFNKSVVGQILSIIVCILKIIYLLKIKCNIAI